MRLLAAMLIVGCITAELDTCAAQDRDFARATASTARPDFKAQSSEKANTLSDFPVAERLLNKWEPVRERLVQDDRLRTLTGVVGLGVLAYEAMPSRQGIPVEFIGTEALRIGLQPQLNALRERTGFTVAPSIGRRRFTVTFRKELE